MSVHVFLIFRNSSLQFNDDKHIVIYKIIIIIHLTYNEYTYTLIK